MIDLTDKINSLPNNILQQFGFTREGLLKKQQTENAALVLCGGLLGNCYIMMEVIGWMLEPCGLKILNRIKQQPWYKQEIKKEINTSLKHLYRNMQSSKENSLTNQNYMQSFADFTYEELENDIRKLSNSIHTLLGKYHIKDDINTLSDFITIDLLLQWITCFYEDTIKKCKNIYSAHYETWYYNARNTGAANHWNNAVSLYFNKFVKDYIDLNTPMIIDGVKVIDNKMRSVEFSDRIKEKALEWAEEGRGQKEFDNSLEVLGLTEKSKHKEQLKKAKREYKKSIS